MGSTAGEIRERIAAADAHLRAAHEAVTAVLALARAADPAEAETASLVLQAVELVGRGGQARDGELIQLLAAAHRFTAHRAGLVPWIATHLNLSQGAARGIDKSARKIGHLPQLSETLSSGQVGADTIRALTRTACAVTGTEQNLTTALAETLELATNHSVREARRHVQVLEETLNPGTAEEHLACQRQRSFVRVVECGSGMTRVEALLDQERATVVRAAIDGITSGVLRARQYDHTEIVPEDVRSTEQIQAHALTRLAELYIEATPEQRAAPFSPQVLYYVPVNPSQDAGLAETIDGQLVPRTRLTPTQNSASHILEYDGEVPVTLDGQPVDQDPDARLASPAQRIALAWRDRHCTHPGCDRPTSWSLHAHHKQPYGANGPTIVKNLQLLCAEHHTLTHHPRM